MQEQALASAAQATVSDAIVGAAARLAAAKIPSARLDAELLLGSVLGADRTWLATHAPDVLPPSARLRFDELLARRARREPLQYIVGHQEFWALDFALTADVLIPRPETELLVELAIQVLARRRGPAIRSLTPDPRSPTPIRICDVGTGSGCVAVAIAHELTAAQIVAVDLSEDALQVARANARRHDVEARIRFLRSDLLDGVGATFDLIVSNPPYVAVSESGTLQPELHYEPARALFAGADGLDIIRRLLVQSVAHLHAHGVLLMEIDSAQADEATRLARAAGFSDVSIELDLAKLARVVVARR